MDRIIIIGLLGFACVGCTALWNVMKSPFMVDVEEVVVDDAKKEVDELKAEQQPKESEK